MQRRRDKRYVDRSFIEEEANDPLTETILDYVNNLAASGALHASHVQCYDNRRSLVRRLLERDGLPSERQFKGDDEDLDDAVGKALNRMIARKKYRKSRPAEPAEPAISNVALISTTLRFDEVETAVLQFAIACLRRDMRSTLDPLPCDGARSPALIIAAALNESTEKVQNALDPKGRLVTSGLVAETMPFCCSTKQIRSCGTGAGRIARGRSPRSTNSCNSSRCSRASWRVRRT